MLPVSVSAPGSEARQFRDVSAALDTAAGAVLVADSAVPKGAEVVVTKNAPALVNASGRQLNISGYTSLQLVVGSLQTTIDVWVVQDLPVPFLLGTPFIQKFVDLIQPRERKVTLRDPETNDRCSVHLETSKSSDPQNRAASWVKAAAAVCVPPMTELSIRVRSERSGLSVIRLSPRHRSPVFLSNGLAELPVDEPCMVWVANFSDNPVTLHRGQVIGVAEEPPSTCFVVPPIDPLQSKDKAVRLEDIELEVSPTERKQVLKMLNKHERLWNGHLGHIKNVQHHIPTVGAPQRQAPYRCGLKTRDAVKDEIERMLRMEVIEPSTSEWAAPIVLIPKPDGSLRFCIDYRRLNEVTVKDSYPLPRMDDCLDSLGSATIFTTLDANSGYWQLDVAKDDRDKTTFTSHMGTFRFTRMPFGLVNAPATFQRSMDVLLAPVLWSKAIVYLDDIIIFSSSMEAHIRDVDQVLSLLEQAGVSLNLKKCAFFRRRVEYLGHIVQPGKLSMAAKKMAAVEQWSMPRTKREMRSFVAFGSVYRKFVPNFAEVAAPLTKALKKDTPEQVNVTEEVQTAFATLKQRLTSPPLLSLPTRDSKFVLETDASNVAIGAALLVELADGTTQPAAFYSRSLTAAERNYSVTEREALAVVWGVKQTRPYVERTKFKIRTDHSALRWLFGAAEENQRICRWRLALAEFQFVVEYRPGRKHVAADTLSRLPAPEATPDDTDLEPPVLIIERPLQPPPTKPRGRPMIEMTQPMPPLSVEEILEAQKVDPDCIRLSYAAEAGLAGYGWSADGLLCKENEEQQPQILVPPRLREVVMHLAHLPPQAAHPGARRMQENISREFYWATLRRDCAEYVSNCLSCTAAKGPGAQRTRPLQLFPPREPWEFVCVDILGPLPTAKSGFRFVVVMSDRFSKYTVAVPLRTTTADDVAHTFVTHWVAYFGVPLILLSDNGPQFASKFLQQVSAVLGVQQRFTSAYHPATNGQAERFNRTVLAMLSHYVTDSTEWDRHLGPAMVAYNSTVHSSTGFAPIEFVRTRAPRILLSGSPDVTAPDKGTWRRRFLEHLAVVGKKAAEKLSHAQDRYKRAYDLHVKARNSHVEVGDWVLVKVFTEAHKLQLPLAGPYEVLAVDRRNGTFQIRTSEGPTRVPSDRVKPAPYPRDLPLGWHEAKESPVELRQIDVETDTIPKCAGVNPQSTENASGDAKRRAISRRYT
jgi:RNase H-like domain found in reverse transcriptase/Reverse transcriptase (RNA-dependent DNA polymerase)/Integrase zinc binding domain/Integrase core domain